MKMHTKIRRSQQASSKERTAMRLPIQARTVTRGINTSPMSGAIDPSGCNTWKKISCAGALLACGAVCVGSLGTACAQCLAGIGAAGCIDCV
jgi:hypothetical protein